MAENSLFQKLTRLFRSGPTIKRKVKNFDSSSTQKSSLYGLLTTVQSDIYNSTINSYNIVDRMSRYADFSAMESMPEIASALNIYAEETTSNDANGRMLHIYSDNRKIREILDVLFYDTLNLDFNLDMWVKNLCKYGDFFLLINVDSNYGIIEAKPVPIIEIEREEYYDPDDYSAIRFIWNRLGKKYLENWQVAHFRLLGNDSFLPYGTSVLESSRRIWRQLVMIEDAMLVYRVVRSPERRVFYIDVGNVPPEEVDKYIEQVKSVLKQSPVVENSTGNTDMRFNAMNQLEDYFLPVRGGESGTRIETLAGGQNTSAIEDVQYIQKKLFAGLKVPKAYLTYDEGVGAKATLAQEDIRFSRTISKIQKTVLAELTKIAMIHLHVHGFQDDELLDFNLQLSNPSSIAQQQKLELINTKFSIASSAPEGLVSKEWILKNVMGFSKDEIEDIQNQILAEKLFETEMENQGNDGEDFGDDEGGDLGADLFAWDDKGKKGKTVLNGSDELQEIDENGEPDSSDDLDVDNFKVNVSKEPKNVFGGHLNKQGVNVEREKLHMPDFASMTSIGSNTRHQDSSNKPFDEEFITNIFKEVKLADILITEPKDNNYNNTYKPRLDKSMKNTLKKLDEHFGLNRILKEGKSEEEEYYDFDFDFELEYSEEDYE